MAVDWIRRNDRKEYLPTLHKLLAVEQDGAFRSFLAREASLLDSGYYVRREKGLVFVTIKTAAGSYSGVLDGDAAALSDEEIVKRFASMNA